MFEKHFTVNLKVFGSIVCAFKSFKPLKDLG